LKGILATMMFFHCFGYNAGWMLALMKGATTIPVAVFDPDETLRLIDNERVSALPGPPTVFPSILDHLGEPEVDVSIAPHRIRRRGSGVGRASAPHEQRSAVQTGHDGLRTY
jgi:acyl-CoA synthetase (AMP-forming)/AMP-acid ligase II